LRKLSNNREFYENPEKKVVMTLTIKYSPGSAGKRKTGRSR
jgi:hypothetical protein